MEKLRPFIDADGHMFERFVEGFPPSVEIEKTVHAINRKILLPGQKDTGLTIQKDIYHAINPAQKYGNKVASLLCYIHDEFPKRDIEKFIQTNSPFLFSYSERFLENDTRKK